MRGNAAVYLKDPTFVAHPQLTIRQAGVTEGHEGSPRRFRWSRLFAPVTRLFRFVTAQARWWAIAKENSRLRQPALTSVTVTVGRMGQDGGAICGALRQTESAAHEGRWGASQVQTGKVVGAGVRASRPIPVTPIGRFSSVA